MISKDSDQSAWPEGTVPRRLPSLSQPLHVQAAQGHLTEKHLAETGGGAPTTTLRFYNSLELAELGKMLSSQSQVCDSWEGSKGKRLKGETRGPGPCLGGSTRRAATSLGRFRHPSVASPGSSVSEWIWVSFCRRE